MWLGRQDYHWLPLFLPDFLRFSQILLAFKYLFLDFVPLDVLFRQLFLGILINGLDYLFGLIWDSDGSFFDGHLLFLLWDRLTRSWHFLFGYKFGVVLYDFVDAKLFKHFLDFWIWWELLGLARRLLAVGLRL